MGNSCYIGSDGSFYFLKFLKSILFESLACCAIYFTLLTRHVHRFRNAGWIWMNDVVLAYSPPLALFDAQKKRLSGWKAFFFFFFARANKRWRFSIKKMFQMGVTFVQWIVGGKSSERSFICVLDIYIYIHISRSITTSLFLLEWNGISWGFPWCQWRITLLETNRSPLPMDGWSSYFPIGARPIFKGGNC